VRFGELRGGASCRWFNNTMKHVMRPTMLYYWQKFAQTGLQLTEAYKGSSLAVTTTVKM